MQWQLHHERLIVADSPKMTNEQIEYFVSLVVMAGELGRQLGLETPIAMRYMLKSWQITSGIETPIDLMRMPVSEQKQ